MAQIFRGALFERDALPAAMTQFGRQRLAPMEWGELARARIPVRGGAVGSWAAATGDPLAEVLVVRDEDFLDSLAWLNSFFAGLSPVTQWCRVLPQSQVVRIAEMPQSITLGHNLGAWVGAVLAECSLQAGGLQNLRDMTGSAAASSATFAAGRAAAIWGHSTDFAQLAHRHAELSHSLREGTRPLPAEALIPLWSVLNGQLSGTAYSDRRALGPLVEILANLGKLGNDLEPADVVLGTARAAQDYFDLPELMECARGPQAERVRALDRLGDRLTSGPRSPTIDALLGLGASFIDPGSVISAELLRRYTQRLPVASIWQGVFAGAMAPLRVMTDQGGLGRLVSKSLLAPSDLRARPTGDVAYEELTRWITPGRSLKLDIRGMSARALAVELVTGVTCTFAYGRSETTTTSPNADKDRFPGDKPRSSARPTNSLEILVASLQKRIERLEAREDSDQGRLDLGSSEPVARKASKPYSRKKP